MGRPVTLVSAFTTHLPEQQIEITQLVYSVEYEGLEELGKVVRLALYVNGRPYWSGGGLKNG